MIEPITVSLFGFALIQQSLTGLQLVGVGMILVTVTAVSVRSRA